MAISGNILNHFWRYFTQDVAIDLGTANTLVYVIGKGVVIREPSTVATHKKTHEVLAIGAEAKRMVGKTPANIVAVRPLRGGVISDFDVAAAMLKYFIRRVHKTHRITQLKIPRPRVAIGIPSGITEVERKAVIDAAQQAGAREVYLLEEPMAAAIGAGLPVEEPTGNMIVDIGGGTSEIAIISLGGIVNSRSIRIAGDELDEQIINWAKTKYNLLIGEKTAEDAKIAIGAATIPDAGEPVETTTIRGRNLKTGLPTEIEISEIELLEALDGSLKIIIENIKDTVEETPPELISDIHRQGMIITGGGALLKRLGDRITREVHIPVTVDADPLTTVVRGCGKALEELTLMRKVQVLQN